MTAKALPVVIKAREAGEWGNSLEVNFVTDVLGRTVLNISRFGDTVESWILPNFDKTSPEYIETILNENSLYVEMEDLSDTSISLNADLFVKKTYAFAEGASGNKVLNVVDGVNDAFTDVSLGNATGTSFVLRMDKFPVNVHETLTLKIGDITLTNEEDKGVTLTDGTNTAVVDNDDGTITVTLDSASTDACFLSGNYMDGAKFVIDALQIFSNPETIDINLLTAPGRTEPAVINKMISICEKQGRCHGNHRYALWDLMLRRLQIGITDPENIRIIRHLLQVMQPFTGLGLRFTILTLLPEKWLPPSGFIAGVYAESDKKGEPWFAPAGLSRGRITETRFEQNTFLNREKEIFFIREVMPLMLLCPSRKTELPFGDRGHFRENLHGWIESMSEDSCFILQKSSLLLQDTTYLIRTITSLGLLGRIW